MVVLLALMIPGCFSFGVGCDSYFDNDSSSVGVGCNGSTQGIDQCDRCQWAFLLQRFQSTPTRRTVSNHDKVVWTLFPSFVAQSLVVWMYSFPLFQTGHGR